MTSEKMKTHLLTLSQGQIKGVKRATIYDQEYYSFEGIPYAQPPVGKLRFKAPQPAEPWTNVLDCCDITAKPVQRNVYTGSIEGKEDCLYVNVYAKKLESPKPLPVMVWIYGGGFYMGGANRDRIGPDYLMFADVVLVTFNYRVGALGFLSLRDRGLGVPGNAGLKDQVLALQWIKQNIANFNGDENNITLFGESAGSASAHFMTCTERARGLFHKAILMSGCVLNQWALIDQSDFAYRLAKHNGYTGDHFDTDIYEFLCGLEPTQLVVNQELLNTDDYRNGLNFVFAPTIEPYKSADCVIAKPPLELLKSAWGNEIPIMIGGTSFEGLVSYGNLKKYPQLMNAYKDDPQRILLPEVRAQHNEETNKELSQMLINLHFANGEVGEKAFYNFLRMNSYRYFWHGFHRTVLSRLAIATAPTYFYRFDFDSPDFNHHRKKYVGDDPIRGAAHADDVDYLFYSRNAWKLKTDTIEFKTIQRMVSIWTAFAAYSDPNCSEILPYVWQPLEHSNPYQVLNIGNDLKIRELPEKEILYAWNTLYTRELLY